MHLPVQVGKAHEVGACHHHVGGGHVGFQLGLQGSALSAFFGEAGGIDDHSAHALGGAALEHEQHVGRGNGQHHEVRGLWQ